MFNAYEEDVPEVMVGRLELIETLKGKAPLLSEGLLGWFHELPEEGLEFTFYGEHLDPKLRAERNRKVVTGVVTEILEDKKRPHVLAFRTEEAIFEVARYV